MKRTWIPLILAAMTVTTCCAGKMASKTESPDREGDIQTPPMPPDQVWESGTPSAWAEIDDLVKNQKFVTALEKLSEMEKSADIDGPEKVRILVRRLNCEISLDRWQEAASHLLASQKDWPDDIVSKTTLGLYLAATVKGYANFYRYEINSRPQRAKPDQNDLKTWSGRQLDELALNTLFEMWTWRESLTRIPASKVAEFIEHDSYPERIRGTLADVVTYRLAATLADSSTWPVEMSETLWKLNLDELAGPAVRADFTSQPQHAHPLTVMSAVLRDLESMKATEGSNEAALEARLELTRLLHGHARQNNGWEERLITLLTKRLDTVPETDWWAEGMAQLAGMTKSLESADRNIRALEICEKCIETLPRSNGAQRCRDTISHIRQREIQQFTAPLFGAVGEKLLKLTTRNIDQVWFRAWKIDYAAEVARLDVRDPDAEIINRFNDRVNLPEPDLEWNRELNGPRDYLAHSRLIDIPVREKGAWVVQVSARKDFAAEDNVIKNILLFPGGPVVSTEFNFDSDEIKFRVFDGMTGAPLKNADIRLFKVRWSRQSPPRELLTKTTTDENGLASARHQPGFDGRATGFVDVEGLTWPISIPGYIGNRSRDRSERQEIRGVILTDRAIYRPGQKIHFKLMTFKKAPDGARLPWIPAANRSMTVVLRDSNHESVASEKVTTNAYGTASGQFEIPSGRMLGNWKLMTTSGIRGNVKVEEYRIPAFTVELDAPRNVRLNSNAELTGRADYFFGLPVSNARVVWKVERQAVWPWWWFGRAATPGRPIASGTASTDETGTFKLNFTTEAEPVKADEPEPDYLFKVSVDITDDAGETRSGVRSFRLGHSAVRADMSVDRLFFEPGEQIDVDVTRRDLNGNSAPGEVSWTMYEIQAPDETPLPSAINDNSGPAATLMEALGRGWHSTAYDPERIIRSWKDGRKIRSGRIRTDDKGAAKLLVNPPDAGLWRIRYSVTDEYGGKYNGFMDLKVIGDKTPTRLPMFLFAGKTSSEVGETVRLAIGSGFEKQYALLQVYGRNGEIDSRHVWLDQEMKTIDYVVDESMRGGLSFKLTAFRKYESLERSTLVSVPWTDRKLDVRIDRLRDRVTPKGRETVSLTVTEHGSSRPVRAAEVLAWMYDRSLDDIVSASFPDLGGIWPHVGMTVQRMSSLGQAKQFWFDSKGFTVEENPWHIYTAQTLKYIDEYFDSGLMRGRGRMMEKSVSRSSPGLGRGGLGMGGGGMLKVAAPSTITLQETSADTDIRDVQRGEAEGREPDQAPSAEVRSNFAETAFFMPHLLTGRDGSVTFEYEVPDSITTWNLMARAQTTDLKSGGATNQVISAKDMMIKPFLPRFLREGDTAIITAVVANTTERELSGTVSIAVTDPESEADISPEFNFSALSVDFRCAPKSETTVRFDLKAPNRVGPASFRITARSGNLSDGELRSVPILPGRFHLMQSRFMTLRKSDGVKRVEFTDMNSPDETRISEKLVVTVDAQLFMSVLKALPYLVDYPYECAEQTMNRFVSTAIMSSLFDRYPEIAEMAKKAAKRETALQPWKKDDPNRKLTLEETPWVREAAGGRTRDVINVLNPEIAGRQKDTALGRLRKMQHADGAFPWFPGGPPSSWVTIYMVSGFAKAMEFGVEIPNDMMSRALNWTHEWYLKTKKLHDRNGWQDGNTAAWLSWVLSIIEPGLQDVFTKQEQAELLDIGMRHFKEMSIGTRSMLTLALHRAERHDQARLVWDSVMDAVRSEPDRGTFWAQEERSWLWYNDSIENHARAIRTLVETDPENKSLDGLVEWIFINRKLNHWKSTRATAEVIYSLAGYLESTGRIAETQIVSVKAGNVNEEFIFDPKKSLQTTAQMVIDGDRVDEKSMSNILVEMKSPGHAMASATWHFSTEKLPEKGDGDLLKIKRTYFLKVRSDNGVVLHPLEDGHMIEPGDEVEVQVSIESGEPMEFVHLRDPRPAGFEPVSQKSGYRWDLGIFWYEEVRDSGQNFFFENLPRGEYTFRYGIRAALAGTYKAAPATIQPMYAPEFAAHSAGRMITVSSRNE